VGWTVVIEVARIAPASPEVVWEMLTDWEHQDDWMLEASDFVVTSARREGVGVEAYATVRIAGISTRDPVRVVEWQPSRTLAIEHGGWVSGRGELHLTLLGRELTHVFWREELRPPLGILGTLGMRALAPVMRKVFARDLRVLAGLARARSAAWRGGPSAPPTG
jgi:hypothetical protein